MTQSSQRLHEVQFEKYKTTCTGISIVSSMVVIEDYVIKDYKMFGCLVQLVAEMSGTENAYRYVQFEI